MPRNTRRIRIRFTTFSRTSPRGYGLANLRTYTTPKARTRRKYEGIRLNDPHSIKVFGFVPVALNASKTIRK